jgi:phosphate-selective porin OprO/OprP
MNDEQPCSAQPQFGEAIPLKTWSLLLLLPVAIEAADKPDPLDNLWNAATLYEDKQNPVVQSVRFTGRFHLDHARVESDQGDLDEWNVRRMRLGAKLKLTGDFTLFAEADFNPQERDPTYVRMTDLSMGWSRDPSLVVVAGKQVSHFSLEGSTSSRELLTVDRSAIYTNLSFPEEFFTGLTASGRQGVWIYHAGIFSSGEKDREFGRLNAGGFGVFSLGADLAQSTGLKEAVVTAEYMHQTEDERNDMTRALAHAGSLHGRFARGRAGLQAEVCAGEGYGEQSNLFGALIMPYVNLTDRVQAVLRLTRVDSDDPAGVRLARYESEVVGKRGERLEELYLGLNWYLRRHQLKIQTGLAWADLADTADGGGDYHGWSWVTGLRVGW